MRPRGNGRSEPSFVSGQESPIRHRAASPALPGSQMLRSSDQAPPPFQHIRGSGESMAPHSRGDMDEVDGGGRIRYVLKPSHQMEDNNANQVYPMTPERSHGRALQDGRLHHVEAGVVGAV